MGNVYAGLDRWNLGKGRKYKYILSRKRWGRRGQLSSGYQAVVGETACPEAECRPTKGGENFLVVCEYKRDEIREGRRKELRRK